MGILSLALVGWLALAVEVLGASGAGAPDGTLVFLRVVSASE